MAGPRRMSGRLRQDASPEHAPVDEGGGGPGGGSPCLLEPVETTIFQDEPPKICGRLVPTIMSQGARYCALAANSLSNDRVPRQPARNTGS